MPIRKSMLDRRAAADELQADEGHKNEKAQPVFHENNQFFTK